MSIRPVLTGARIRLHRTVRIPRRVGRTVRILVLFWFFLAKILAFYKATGGDHMWLQGWDEKKKMERVSVFLHWPAVGIGI